MSSDRLPALARLDLQHCTYVAGALRTTNHCAQWSDIHQSVDSVYMLLTAWISCVLNAAQRMGISICGRARL